MKHIRRLFFVLLLGCLFSMATGSDAQTGFQLIVNEDNPYRSISKEQASDFFLKKDRSWDDGTPARPVDSTRPQAVREAFSAAVLDSSLNEVKKYWQRRIFTGRDSSPPEKASETDVLEYVRENRGAIGYVSTSAKLGAGVRKIDLN